MRKVILVLILIALLIGGGFYLYQGSSTPQPELGAIEGTEGLQIRTYGEEHMITIEAGSLISTNPTTETDRRQALINYIKENRELFDAPPDVDLSFAAATSEFEFLKEDQPYILVALYQTYRDTPIIDRVIYGGFARTGEREVELRMVRAYLRETSELPVPQPGDEAQRLEAEALFREQLIEDVSDGHIVVVSEAPVISAEFNLAGYLVWRAADYNDGSISHLAAVINVENQQVQELYNYQLDNFGNNEE